jgi:hypothetical protein
MHAVTRLGRVIQQLRSFGELHASELEAMAVELEVAGAAEVATRLRLYRDVQRDESQIVVDELTDIQNEAAAVPVGDAASPPVPAVHDPAINSPKRARWLAEQAAEAERLKQPFSRRGLFGGGREADAVPDQEQG